MVDYAARIAIQLVLAPMVLRYLGAGGFGTWQVLQKPGGPRHARRGTPRRGPEVGGRARAVVDDVERKRQQVGTAVAVWAFFPRSCWWWAWGWRGSLRLSSTPAATRSGWSGPPPACWWPTSC